MWDLLDKIAQFALPIFGITAIVLIAKKNKWGTFLSLVAIPFWFITAIKHRQWGVVITHIGYACSWAYAFYSWFFKKPKDEPVDKSK